MVWLTKSGVKTLLRVLTIHIVQQERYAEYLFSLYCIAVRNSHPRRAAPVHICYHISILVLGLEPIILFQTVRRISVFHLNCPADGRVDVRGPARLAVPACLPLFLAIISVRVATPSWFSLQPDIGRSVVRCLLSARRFATIGKLCPPSSSHSLAFYSASRLLA